MTVITNGLKSKNPFYFSQLFGFHPSFREVVIFLLFEKGGNLWQIANKLLKVLLQKHRRFYETTDSAKDQRVLLRVHLLKQKQTARKSKITLRTPLHLNKEAGNRLNYQGIGM